MSVSVKKLNCRNLYNQEVLYLTKLAKSNAVPILSMHFEDKYGLFFVMTDVSDEYMSLREYIKTRSDTELDVPRVFKKMIEALSFLYSHQCFHRRLNSNNVMIEEGNVKVTNFEQAVHFDGHCQLFSSVRSLNYDSSWAPELLFNLKYTTQIDVWSFGTMLYEMLHRKPYIRNIVLSSSKIKERSPLHSVCKSMLIDLPSQRMSAEKLCQLYFA